MISDHFTLDFKSYHNNDEPVIIMTTLIFLGKAWRTGTATAPLVNTKRPKRPKPLVWTGNLEVSFVLVLIIMPLLVMVMMRNDDDDDDDDNV